MMHAVAATYRNLTARAQLKVVLSIALTLGFCIPYFLLQRFPILPARHLDLSAVDLLIPFMPGWVWVYQSVYILLSIVPWLSPSAADVKRYASGFMLQSCVGFTCFLLWPIHGPRPGVLPDDVMFQVLVSYDGTLNSFPSLHVGLSVYTVLFAVHASRGRMRSRPRSAAIGLLGIWSAAIAFAALATKQHYALDLPAGALLAIACDRWIWRQDARSARPAERVRPAATVLSSDVRNEGA